MKKIFNIHIGILTVFLLIPFVASAETVLRVASEISVDQDQVVEGDYYAGAGLLGKIVMSGTVTEDMYAAAASAIINGDIGKDLTLITGTASLHATVTDDVRIVGGDVTIAGDVGGDLFVIAGNVSLLSTAHVAGDVFFFGGDLQSEGSIDGSLFGNAQKVRIDGRIGKDIDMTAHTELVLEDNADIAGALRYKSTLPLSRAQGSSVSGDIQRIHIVTQTPRAHASAFLTPLFIILFAALSLYLLAKRDIEYVVAQVEHSFIKNILIGAAVLFLGPIIAVILLVSVLGMFVGVIALLLVMLLNVLALILSGVVFGTYIMKFFTKKTKVTLLSIIIGSVLLQIITLLPVVGVLIVFVIYTVTLGAIAHALYRSLHT